MITTYLSETSEGGDQAKVQRLFADRVIFFIVCSCPL